jgi:hypothetical protein
MCTGQGYFTSRSSPWKISTVATVEPSRINTTTRPFTGLLSRPHPLDSRNRLPHTCAVTLAPCAWHSSAPLPCLSWPWLPVRAAERRLSSRQPNRRPSRSTRLRLRLRRRPVQVPRLRPRPPNPAARTRNSPPRIPPPPQAPATTNRRQPKLHSLFPRQPHPYRSQPLPQPRPPSPVSRRRSTTSTPTGDRTANASLPCGMNW